MTLDADTLLERLHLKRQLRWWKFLTVAAVVAALASAVGGLGQGALSSAALTPFDGHSIARYTVEDIITDDLDRDELFKETAENASIKAVIIHMDSPGGTAVGGERLYKSLQKLNEKKPVVVVMKTIATSAAYMASLGGTRIFAQEGTITGSIGVIMQMLEFTELARKLGIEPVNFKSSPLKAAPSPLEKVTPESAAAADALVKGFYDYFRKLVKEHRKLDENTLALVADGRVFTGAQALELKLVDAIGGEDEAVAWLKAERGIDASLPVRTIEVKREPSQWLKEAVGSFAGIIRPTSLIPGSGLAGSGLMAIWHPER